MKQYYTLKIFGCFNPGRLDFHIDSILLRFCNEYTTFLLLKSNSIWILNEIFGFALIRSCYIYLLWFSKYTVKVFILMQALEKLKF